MMSCEECRAILDESVEDELGEKQSPQMAAHISDCAECDDYYEDLKRERQIYFRYFMSLDATPALWAGVQAGIKEIEHKRVTARRRFRERLAAAFSFLSSDSAYGAAAMALAFLVMLGAVVVVLKYRFAETNFQPELTYQKSDAPGIKSSSGEPAATNSQVLHDEKDAGDGGEPVNNSTSKTLVVRSENRGRKITFRSTLVKRAIQNSLSASAARKSTIDEVIEKAERQYLNAIVMLSRDIKRRRSQLAPNLVSRLDESLAEIDRTIKETKRAVETQPNDAVAIQYMTAAYAKKAELLRTIAAGN